MQDEIVKHGSAPASFSSSKWIHYGITILKKFSSRLLLRIMVSAKYLYL